MQKNTRTNHNAKRKKANNQNTQIKNSKITWWWQRRLVTYKRKSITCWDNILTSVKTCSKAPRLPAHLWFVILPLMIISSPGTNARFSVMISYKHDLRLHGRHDSFLKWLRISTGSHNSCGKRQRTRGNAGGNEMFSCDLAGVEFKFNYFVSPTDISLYFVVTNEPDFV